MTYAEREMTNLRKGIEGEHGRAGTHQAIFRKLKSDYKVRIAPTVVTSPPSGRTGTASGLHPITPEERSSGKEKGDKTVSPAKAGSLIQIRDKKYKELSRKLPVLVRALQNSRAKINDVKEQSLLLQRVIEEHDLERTLTQARHNAVLLRKDYEEKDKYQEAVWEKTGHAKARWQGLKREIASKVNIQGASIEHQYCFST